MTTLVVTDFDGTLWDRELGCHPRSLQALRMLQARDDVVVLAATGRRRNSARQAMSLHDIVLPAVLLNGAVGFDFRSDDLFHTAPFAGSDLHDVVDVLARHRIAPVAYLADTRALVIEGVTTSAEHLQSLGGDIVWGSFDDLVQRADVLGMSMLGVEASLVMGALEELTRLPAAEAVGYNDHLYAPFSFMIAPSGVTKAVGIDAFCRCQGLVPDQTIALGDGGNDLPMLEAADIAVVVADADPRALALADVVIGPPELGGWADVLDLL